MRPIAILSRRRFLGVAAMGAAIGLGRPAAANSDVIIQRLDWAGVRIVYNQIELLIDVSAPPPPLDPAPKRSFALATHHHGDHFNPAVLSPLLGERGYAVLHADVAALVDQRALKLQTTALYEPVFFSRASGDFVAWCVPAADGFGDPQVSWIIDVGGRRIIHCGDTLWHGDWWKISRAYGPFDAAFMPINGARQPGGMISDVGQSMMMGPREAAAAAAALNTRLAIPVHYGLDANGYHEVPNALQAFRQAGKRHGLRVQALEPGERINL